MSKIRFTVATTVATTVAIASAIALAGCSMTSGSMDGMHDDSPSPTLQLGPNTGAFTNADIAFATGMVPHHEQAVEMADLVLGKDGIDAQVTDLAQRIKAAQDPEIVLMSAWLETWGHPIDSMGDMPGMPGMDSGDGMMSDADMSQLAAATGVEASRLFLQQMIVHHQGALRMATTEMADGENPAALELANAIVSSQTAEIAEMQALLKTLS